MKLEWRSYGDAGRTALGDQGRWRVITDGKWWHLTVQPAPLEPRKNVGKCFDRQRAMALAQEREDGVEIHALGIASDNALDMKGKRMNERIDKLADVICAGIHPHNSPGEIQERLQHDRTRYRRAAQAALDCYYADDDG